MQKRQRSVKINAPEDEHCDLFCPLMVGDRCYLGDRNSRPKELEMDLKGYLRTAECRKQEIKEGRK